MNSFISWIGGKKLLRKEICNRFPDTFDRYIEVFGGAAWVLFYKDKHAKMEIYNDINSNLVNLFKCVKYHPNAIKEELECIVNSREFFSNFKELYTNSSLTDIQRAAMYFYMIKFSYGSNVTSFGAKTMDIGNAYCLTEVKKRLNTVIIENKSFDGLIIQYDRAESLFYCDPPYYGAERLYDTGDIEFNKEQHIKLSEVLKQIKGKCIISYNDDDYIRNLYKDFNIEYVERTNNLAGRYGKNKTYKELIIRNY